MARAKGTRVTQEEVLKMVELYRQLGTYKAVAKKLHRDSDTVAKYIQQFEVSQMAMNVLAAQGVTKAVQVDNLENEILSPEANILKQLELLIQLNKGK